MRPQAALDNRANLGNILLFLEISPPSRGALAHIGTVFSVNLRLARTSATDSLLGSSSVEATFEEHFGLRVNAHALARARVQIPGDDIELALGVHRQVRTLGAVAQPSGPARPAPLRRSSRMSVLGARPKAAATRRML